MIAVVDSGGANLSSVLFALERLGQLGADAKLTADAGEIRRAEKVLLPGVGAAGAVMRNLREKNLVECLRGLTQPVLGICLGMQILFESSEEGDIDCLGVIPGRVRRLEHKPGFPIPHMGWNEVRPTHANPIFDEKAYFYFVHSYAVPSGDHVIASCEYEREVPAIVSLRNFSGAQFHPERSGAAGARLLKRFFES